MDRPRYTALLDQMICKCPALVLTWHAWDITSRSTVPYTVNLCCL